MIAQDKFDSPRWHMLVLAPGETQGILRLKPSYVVKHSAKNIRELFHLREQGKDHMIVAYLGKSTLSNGDRVAFSAISNTELFDQTHAQIAWSRYCADKETKNA